MMIKKFLIIALVGAVCLCPQAWGDCNNPPQGQGGPSAAWWVQYKSWCRGCGGTICDYANDCQGICTRGPNWGANGGGSSAPLSVGSLPPPANLQQAITEGLAVGVVNGLWEGLNAPAQPLTPEQIEAQRQAELALQRAEAERQQKIQNYLDDEARKKREHDALLDKEAQISLALVDNKGPSAVAVSDQALISGSSGDPAPVSHVCASAIEGMSDKLNDFGKEANQEGYQFVANDILKDSRKALGAAGDGMQSAAWEKVGMKEYADDYKILKEKADMVKKNAESMKELQNCIETKGCSLMALAEKYNKETSEWIKNMSTEGIQQSAERVKKAASFLQNYTLKIEQYNEKIISGESKCLAQ